MSDLPSSIARIIEESSGHMDHLSQEDLIDFIQEIDQSDPVIRAKPQVQVAKARLLQTSGNEREAQELFSDLIINYPNDVTALIAYGQFMKNKGEPQQALNHFSRAVQLDPHHATAHQELGRVFQESGYFEQAAQHFEQASHLAPENIEIQKELSTLLTRFVPPWHVEMLADHERNQAFYEAIRKAVDPNSVVLDIGTGSGLLSMMAANSGAKKVVTCEQSTFLAKTAQKIVSKNGLSEKIEVLNSKSTDLHPHHFPEKPNLLVAEIFDAGLIGEWAIPTFRHALKKLCTPDCKLIPQRATVIARLVELPDYSEIHPIRNIEGFDLSEFSIFQTKGEYVQKLLPSVKHHFLSEEIELKSYKFLQLEESIPLHRSKNESFEITCSANGQVTAVAFWFHLWLDDEIVLSSGPERTNNHWNQAVFFFQKQKSVRKGDLFKLTMRYNDYKIWFEE